MASMAELLEAERRGILPSNKLAELQEARDRGLIPNLEQPLTAQEAAAIGAGGEISPPGEVRREPSKFPIGATLGGGLFAAAGGPTPAAIPLAGLGAAAGEAGEQLIRRGLGLDVPETSLEAATQIAKEGALGTLGEGVGRGGLFVAGKVFSPFIGKVTPAAREAIDFLEARLPTVQRGRFNPLRYIFGADKKKLALLPAEATDAGWLDTLENITESSLIGGSRIREFKANKKEFFTDIADDIVKGFGETGSEAQVGDLIVGTVKGELDASRLVTSGMYNAVDDMTRGLFTRAKTLDGFGNAFDAKVPIISTKALKDWARPRLAVAQKAGKIDPSLNGTDLLSAVMDLDDNVDYGVMKILRSKLRARATEFSINNKKAPAIGVSKSLKGIADKAIESGLKEHSPKALKLWREANALYAQDNRKLNSTFLRSLVSKADEVSGGAPETLVNKIFKKNNVSRIREVRKAVGGKESSSWKKMQGWGIQDLFSKSTKKDGTLVGENLTEAMFGRTGLGQKAMENIFTKEQVSTFKQLANALTVSQAKQGGGSGKILIQLTQAGALLSLPFQPGSALSSASGVILLGPAVLARAFTNPKIASVLINGLKTGTKTKVAAGALGRFITDLTNMQLEQAEATQ